GDCPGGPPPLEQGGAAVGAGGVEAEGRDALEPVVKMARPRIGEREREVEATLRERERVDVETRGELARTVGPADLVGLDAAAGEEAIGLVAQLIREPRRRHEPRRRELQRERE